jgi:hypothetical protein
MSREIEAQKKAEESLNIGARSLGSPTSCL